MSAFIVLVAAMMATTSGTASGPACPYGFECHLEGKVQVQHLLVSPVCTAPDGCPVSGKDLQRFEALLK